MRKRIAIDQDQVLADLLSPWLERYNKDYNDSLRVDQITHWNWHDLVKPECGAKIYEYLDDQELFEGLPVVEGSQEIVYKLSKKYDVFVVTSPWNPNNIIAKRNWLEKHFSFLDPKNFVFTQNKSIIQADYMIDDKPDNFNGFVGEGLLYTAPHNQLVQDFKRVDNWHEIDVFFEEIAFRI